MQLPRGTFRELKKGLPLHSLIREMADSGLTGYCKIVSSKTSILLVFSGGKIILAECGALTSRAAMDEISRTGGEPVDAVLHDLSETQIKLALEFNPSARVDQQGRVDRPGTEPAGQRSTADAPRVVFTLPPEGPAKIPSRVLERGGFSGHPIPSAGGEDETALLMRDLDALDALGIQTMTEKFRANCRQMIEKLELEHLLEKNQRNENP
jgi:hypothetical protein